MSHDEEENWTSRYAEYLEQQMEAQYNHEIAEQYKLKLVSNPSSIEDDLPHQILHLPLESNDTNAATVGEYLGLLLSTLWVEADGFSGKRPFGNSDWQYTVYEAMGKAGLIEMTFDEDGYIEEFSADEEYKADELILSAIKLAYNHEG